ncbi:MAG: DUF131 domain-containing protein [Candidatus Hydrothermarchaeaceae archaeon]
MKELLSIGIILIFLGMVVLMAGILSESSGSTSKFEGKGAGIVMIGPIPIIFGTDEGSVKFLLFSRRWV